MEEAREESSQDASSPSADSISDTASGFGLAGEWVVTPSRVGPIRLGVSLTEALPFLAQPIDTIIGGGCEYARPVGGPADLSLMVEGGRVVRVDVMGGSTETAEGAKIGDTEERILELYPSARQGPHKYTSGSYLVVLPFAPHDTIHRYVFETDGARVTLYRAGLYPPVEYVEGCL